MWRELLHFSERELRTYHLSITMFVSYLLLLSASALAYVPSALYDVEDAENIFEDFINKYNKEYASEQEKQDRFNIFKEQLAIINKLRVKQPQALFDIHEHFDLTRDEFESRYHGYLPELSTIEPEKVIVRKNLPESFDWRENNAVTPIKDQGACGSCWAFSTTGTIEGAYAMKHKQLLSFSAQQLVACDDLDNKCRGGNMINALNYLQGAGGIQSETDYPYEAVNGTCKFDKSKVVAQITGQKAIQFGNDDETKQALIDNGPMSIAIWASSDEFRHYTGGVIKCPSGTYQNHAVLLVGYGKENGTPYWIIKNSWGQSRGDQGYWKVMQGNNPCGMDDVGGIVAQVA